MDDAPVRMVEGEGVRAWVSDVVAAPAPSVERARAHDRVVREAMRASTPLPARFGQMLSDDEALRQALRERATVIAEVLARVEGMVEMTVRLRLTGEPPEKSLPRKGLSGREYMSALRRRMGAENALREEAEFLQARVARAVSTLAQEVARGDVAAGQRALVISHLVRRTDVDTYRRAVRESMQEHPSQPVMISGPWAPYSFAQLPRG